MSLAAERRVNLKLSIPPEASNTFCQKEHQHEKITNARIIKARERRISMLTKILEPSYNEPFYFLYITAKDGRPSSLGETRNDFRNCLLQINKMNPMPKFIALCGGVTGEEICKEGDIVARKVRLEEELSCLDPQIKVLYVASSGDFKDRLNEDFIETYRLYFGDDWYEFWVCGVAFLVINTAYYSKQIEDSLMATRDEQNDWIDSQLLQQQIFQAKRTIILQDRAPPRRSDGGGSQEDTEEKMLEELLIKYNIAGVTHLLCRQNPSLDEGESEGCETQILANEINDSDRWFVGLVKISAEDVHHESFDLQGLPKQVYL